MQKQYTPHPRPTYMERIEAARERGVTGFKCVECGYEHRSIHMLGRTCNAAHQDMDNHDGEACGGELREIITIPAHNPVTGTVRLPIRVGGAA